MVTLWVPIVAREALFKSHTLHELQTHFLTLFARLAINEAHQNIALR